MHKQNVKEVEYRRVTFSDVSPPIQSTRESNVSQVVAPRHDEASTSSQPRRSQRVSHLPDTFVPSVDFVWVIDSGEPSCYKEAMLARDHAKWELAMKSKLAGIEKNGTWDLVPLPKDKKELP